MEKITLAGKDYELPEVKFQTIQEIGKMGFYKDKDDTFEQVVILVAYITRTTVKEASDIVNEHCKKFKDFVELQNKLNSWLDNSDFFEE